MTTLKIPHLGESVTNATIIAVHISQNDKINKDDIVLEIETDKATIDIPADKEGKIIKVLVKIGDDIKQGQDIAEIKEIPNNLEAKDKTPITINISQEQTNANLEVKDQAPITNTGNKKTEEVLLQELGDGIKEVSILKIFVEKGQTIKQGDALLEVETDKATLEVPSMHNALVQEIFVKKGQTIKIGTKIIALKIATDNQKTIDNAQDSKTITSKNIASKTKENDNIAASNNFKIPTNDSIATVNITTKDKILVPASPIVRRFAREIGVDLTQVTGTLEKGRICIEDVKTYTKNKNQLQTNTFSTNAKLPDFTALENVERVSLKKIKQVTAKVMSQTWQTIPHVTNFHEVDITNIEATRKKYKKNGTNLTITIILIKTCAIALQKFSNFNASYDPANQELILKKYIHLGLAVETAQGLVVPVIQDVDKKNILTLQAEILDISQKARNRKLAPEQLQGQGFTISSLGGIGNVRGFTPLINYPDVAILGIARSDKQAKYIDGVLVPRIILPLSLSYDHRVIDGAEATRFMDYLISLLEESVFPFEA